jgi:chitinase
MRIPALLLALSLIACAHFPPGPRHEIVGYYPGWKESIPVEPSLLTVINYAFLDIGRDGRLVLVDPPNDEKHFRRLAAIKADFPHVKLVASVGGWTRSYGFSNMAASASMRAGFIESSLAFLKRYGFDGIDLDWEYPGAIGVPCAVGQTCDRPEDKRNYVTLARELRAALDAGGRSDGKRYVATIAAGADRKFLYDGDSARWMVEMAEALDWINLMTYDYHGSWERRAEMLASLRDIDATVTMYLAAGVPSRSLTLGIPFYGKGWIGCDPGPRGDGFEQPCAAAVSDPPEATFEYWRLRREGYLDGSRGFARHRDGSARVPYLYAPSSGTFITHDDETSIGEKVRYLKARGLLGAMYWELSADHERELGRAVARELK